MATRASMPLRRLLVAGSLALVASLSVVPGASPAHATTGGLRSEARDSVDAARAAYEAARAQVAALSAQHDRLETAAQAAEAEAQRLHDAADGAGDGFLDAVGDFLDPGPSVLEQAAQAAADAEDARDLADRVGAALADQIAATEQARVAWERAERRQARVEASWTAGQAAEAAIRRAHFLPSYAVGDPAQDRRNRRALEAWHTYLRQVASVGVVPPPVADLADPARLDTPLEPLRDSRNVPSPGVAAVDRTGRPAVTVLSAEAVRAVSDAFRRVGLPEVPGAIEPRTYACGGLVANAWGASSSTADVPGDVADQWTELRPVPAASLQTGDVVVLGSRKRGVDETGVYVGAHQVIRADPDTGVAAVRPLTRTVLGVRRVGVAATTVRAALPSGGTCGVSTATASTGSGSGPLQLPMADGSYRLTAGFGDAGARWSTGMHTGQDFAAPVGTPVFAAGAGTVTVEHPAWAGNLVRIDHGGGVETLYAHLSRVDVTDGQQLSAGDPVGLVGALGNTSGPHLHFEVRLDGEPYDPAAVLSLPELPRPEYPNGELPDSALCPATSDGTQVLRCDAAVAYRLLGAAYATDFGSGLCITDSYRSRNGQEKVFAAKPRLAAVPGTSVHGLGLAVDLCGGIERFGSDEFDWMVAHAPSYGWVHPGWAGAGGSRPEPWHFEYVGADA